MLWAVMEEEMMEEAEEMMEVVEEEEDEASDAVETRPGWERASRPSSAAPLARAPGWRS